MYLKYILLILGILVCWYRWQNLEQENQFSSLVGQEISVYGFVMAEPSFSSSGNQIVIIQPEGFTQKLRISLFRQSSVQRGDYVLLRGVIKLPENFTGFNYIKFLQKDNIFAEVSKAKIIPIAREKSSWQNSLFYLKQFINQKISRQLSKDHAGIILGMLIGDDSKISQTTEQIFKKTGLTHVLVVSGFNLTVLATSTSVLAWVLGRKFADGASLIIIWSFVLLVGAGSSVVRAGIMVSLLLLARLLGRLSYSYITLLWAIFIMTALNPLQLIYDIGFQLSVAATLGVLQAYRLKTLLDKDSMLSEILWPSIGAIIYTAPVVAWYFEMFNTFALPANLLVVPTIPVLMLFGVLLLFPIINLIVAPIIDLILTINLSIMNLISSLQFSVVNFHPSIILILCYYLVLFFLQYFIFLPSKPDLKNNFIRDKMVKIKL